jgi:hypothetical protein
LRERWAYVALGAAMLVIAIVYAIARPTSERGPLPSDPAALARRIRKHPADWRAASAMTEQALDARVPNRFALWHAARDLAVHLAPARQAPRIELVRAALFHWQELSPADRRAALETLGPLLRDPPMFFDMARPIFELTGDVGMLRRWNPGTEQTLSYVQNIAAINGRFADYRGLRDELARKRIADFHAKLPHLSPVDLIAALPPPPYSTTEEPLLREALAELHRRPLTEDPHRIAELDALVDYALRHRLEPLDGINSIVRIPGSASDLTRFRLANAFGMSPDAFTIRVGAKGPLTDPPRGEWQNLDNGNVKGRSWIDREMRGATSVTVETVKSDEVPPYVEIYLDDARVAEGEVAKSQTFAIPASAGVHRLEVRVVNPSTRNATPRIVRVVSVAP